MIKTNIERVRFFIRENDTLYHLKYQDIKTKERIKISEKKYFTLVTLNKDIKAL